jgi:hypothetical protein
MKLKTDNITFIQYIREIKLKIKARQRQKTNDAKLKL